LSAVLTIAGLTWKRLFRSKLIWVTALLVIAPLALAAVAAASMPDAGQRWDEVGQITFRSLVLLAPVLHLAPAVGEEQEGKTYTYLWSRPVPRAALVLGKMVCIVPVLCALAAFTTAATFAALSTSGGLDAAALPRSVVAAVAGVISASAFAVGVGALFPRHPLVVALGWVFFAEQILPDVTAVQNVTTLYHVRRIADGAPGGVAGGLLALAILTAIWLTVAVVRLRRLEFGSAEG
jgi:ABC-2 type transport system permease protein